MDNGGTVICVRRMHMATLLRACALLVAQQIAFLGSTDETVGFSGIPMTEATQCIYGYLFFNLGGRNLRPLRKRIESQRHQSLIVHALLRNEPEGIIPQSITNVANILWAWYRNKAFMYKNGPLPAQIQHTAASQAPVWARDLYPHSNILSLIQHSA